MNALVFSHLLLAWSMIARSTREDPSTPATCGRCGSRRRVTHDQTDWITADDVDADRSPAYVER